MSLDFLIVFFIATIISFVGTIPPATINISVLQLTLRKKAKMAISLALGAAIIDLLYTLLSLEIGDLLEKKLHITNYFQLVTAIIFIILGVASLVAKPQTNIQTDRLIFMKYGFIRGVLLGLFNPLIIPFWLVVSTYLESNGWITLDGINYWLFLLGTFIGEISLLLLIVKLGQPFTKFSDNRLIVYILPGVVFIIMGLYSIINWIGFYV